MSDREEPLDFARIYAVAEEHLKNGELHEARHQFKRAFQYGADPSKVDVLVEMAAIFTAKEWWREAEESLLEALRVDPDNKSAESMLRELHSQPDRFCGIKPEYDELAIQRYRESLTLSRVPRLQLFIELTNRCNGKCITCLNRSMNRERGVMDFDLFKKIVTESSDRLYLELVHLYGVGEDYLIPNVLDYLDYATRKFAERGIRTCLITNGELITDLPDGISVVDISFNGGKKETYERITGIPFDKTVTNIWRLEREGQLDSQKNLRMLVFNENESEVDDFKKLFACTSANMAFAYKFDNQCGEIEDQTVEECRSARRIPCHYVRGVMNITWNGDVILCPHDFEGVVKYGNAGEQSLTDIWYGASHREMLKKHAAHVFEGLCKECNFNVPIEGKVLEVSRQERIALRKRHLDYAVENMVGCSRASTCEIVRRYRDDIDERERNPDEPLIRICSDDYRFYGIRTVMDRENHTYCSELQKLRERFKESRVCWESPTFGPSGYAFASRGYLIGAADLGLAVRSQPLLGDCRVTEIDDEGLDDEWHKIDEWVADKQVAFAMKSPVDKPTLSRLIQLTNTPLGGVYVCGHIPTDHEGRDFYQEFRERTPGMTAYVGYTMFETDGIPDLWVDACNRMDEIWVPCHFNMETFGRCGVDTGKIHVIPIGFQPEHYRPELCEPLDSVKRKGFNFLSIFEWTYRKGWDVLIRAYLEEFGEEEDVKLVLRAYQGGGVIGEDAPPVSNQLTDFITNLGYDPERVPDIELLDQMVPARDMPNLYKVGDAFVLPTRGEGWGIPLTESMLMEVPVIATRWSGHLEFMSDENAYLIDVERMVPVHPDQIRDNPLYQGQHWAEPSVQHTRALMRHLFENRREGKEKARLGRRHILENFTIHHAAARIHQRVAARQVRHIPHVHPEAKSDGTKPGDPTPSRAAKASLRVLLQARPDLFTLPGGDTEVVLNLKKSLEGQGVTADFSSNPQIPLDDYDLVHIFNFGTPFAVNAAIRHKPYVCTPLYEDAQRYLIPANETAYAFREFLESRQGEAFESAPARTLCRGTLKVLPHNRFMVEHADRVFVSGESEGHRIRQDFLNVGRTQVLKFGFQRPEDPDAIDADLFRSEFGIRDYVLCVGRLETRKNQLMLLRALQDMDVPLVFVNGNTPHPEYEDLCKGFERAGSTLFTGRLSKSLLLSAYKGAKVHALPSWYELPGLVSLEAAWLGCNVVASTWGTVGDYLGDHYYPCEPDDPSSIREAVGRAMATPYEPAARQVLEGYTLDDFTRKTMKQYEKVLSTSKTRKAARRFSERAKLAEKELAYQRLKGRALALVDRDPKKAEEEASRLLGFRSDDPTLHYIRGEAAVLLFDYEAGESQLKKSIDLFPCADIKPYFYLAALLRQQGRHQEALDVLLAAQRVFVSLPDDVTGLLQKHLQSSYVALEGAGAEEQNGLSATGT